MSTDISSGQSTIDSSDSNVTDLAQSLHDCLALIQDHRSTRTLLHQLSDILTIAVLSVIAGGNGWEDMELYGLSKYDWLSTFLELPNGIPSPDTFRRVFEKIRPNEFEGCFEIWVRSVLNDLFPQLIAIDGKEIRGSYDREAGTKSVSQLPPLHESSQWAGFQTVIAVERIRHLRTKTTHEIQFYLSSLSSDSSQIPRAIRQHWGVENSLHWVLDVTFNEDVCRVRSLHAPHNLALVRRFALNILNCEHTFKGSLKQKSKRAAMDNRYMLTLLASAFPTSTTTA